MGWLRITGDMHVKPSSWCWAQHQCSAGSCPPLQMGQLVATSPRGSRLLRGRLHSSATVSTSHRLSSWLLGWCGEQSEQFLRREPCASGPHPTCWGLIPSQGRLCARQVPKVVFPGHAATSDMDSHMQEQGKQRRPEADH